MSSEQVILSADGYLGYPVGTVFYKVLISYNVKFREIIIRLEIKTYLCEEKHTNGMQSLLVILIVITGIILPTQVKGEREDYMQKESGIRNSWLNMWKV